MKIGYDKELTEETLQSFTTVGAVMSFSKPSNQQTDTEYFEEFLLEHENDEIILNSLESIGSYGFTQLQKSLNIIAESNIDVVFLNPTIEGVNISEDFLDVLRAIVTFEKKAVYNRTIKGLRIARSKGRIGGRPRISDDTIARIHFLHDQKKMSLREIAEKLELSLATVYKYASLEIDNS